jgi:Ca-activated chloride channel family protein
MYQKYACRRCCSEPLRKSKQIVSQIINQLGNDRIGIVAYGSAFPVLPITTDYSVAKCFCKA